MTVKFLDKGKLDNNSINLILFLVLSSKIVGAALTGVEIRFSLLRQLYIN